MTGQQRLEALLRAARVYESHEIAMAAPEVQAAIREMAPLVERDPVREMAMRLSCETHERWYYMDGYRARAVGIQAACIAADMIEGIDAELAHLRAARAADQVGRA